MPAEELQRFVRQVTEGTQLLFDRSGRRLDAPQSRAKPGIIGPDAGNTSFFYFRLGFSVPGSSEDDMFPNFSGT